MIIIILTLTVSIFAFQLKLRKKNNQNLDIDTDLITANNFFAHFVNEISITKYGSDKELIPTFLPLRNIPVFWQYA